VLLLKAVHRARWRSPHHLPGSNPFAGQNASLAANDSVVLHNCVVSKSGLARDNDLIA